MMVIEGRKQTYAWRPGPSIRECCLHHGLAQAAWWWEVDQRFTDLARDGLEDNPELAQALLGSKKFILGLLEDTVPRPSKEDKQAYREFRKLHRKPRKVTIRLPSFAKTLGITWPCSPEDLKATWRKLALQHHPDRGGRPEEFIRIKAAYDQACGRIS